MRLSGGLHELGLSQSEWQRVAPVVVRRRTIRRGEILFAAGEVPSALFEVHAGCFKTCVTSENGREQVTGFQIVGDFVGLEGLGSERQVSEGVALEDSQVHEVPLEVLSRLCRESADFQHRFHKLMSQEADRARHMMFLLGSTHAMERVATFLLDLLQRLNARGYSSSAVHLCMTRDEIGSYLGLTLETVSRMLASLKHSGIVEVTNRDLRILDSEALRRAATGGD